MNTRITTLIIFLSVFILTSCSSYTGYYTKPPMRENFLNEVWMYQMDMNPNNWTKGADRWFLHGEPNQIEQFTENGPISQAMSATMVRVPDFTNILIDGRFEVQILGQQDHNSFAVIGPHQQTRQVIVEVKGNTLCVRQARGPKGELVPLNKILIRIGVRNLCKLISRGACLIEGRAIQSNNLVIDSSGMGNILLSGNINLKQVNHSGRETLTVLGIYSPNLNINVRGHGNVNLIGKMRVRTINHFGNGIVNVVGVDSTNMTISTGGFGKTAVAGYVNLKQLRAYDGSCVYVYFVNSDCLYVQTSRKARVGLAGFVKTLYGDMTGASVFSGQYLSTNQAYIRTQQIAHANIAVNQKLFSTAANQSSIYYFGPKEVVATNTSEQGTVTQVWNDKPFPYSPTPRPIFHGTQL